MMRYEYFFPIAGVQFKVIAKKKIMPDAVLSQDICRQFFLKNNKIDIIDFIDVHLTDESAPRIDQLDRIFDSQTSWAIYAHRDDFYITDQYPPYNSPVWTARIHSKENQITLYCSSDIIDQQKKQLMFNPFTYPLDQIVLMNFLADHGGGLFHSAGMVYNSQGVIFAGKSGAGKSTISGQLQKFNQTMLLSDDRIAVRKIGDSFVMFGTPWPGEGGFAVNQSAPLKSIFFLKKGNENKLTDLNAADAMALMFPVMSIPWYDRDKVNEIMDFCESLLVSIPMYELTFRADETVAAFVMEFLNRENSIV